MASTTFKEFFIQATGQEEGPYPYQEKLATGDEYPDLLEIATGLGKTAAATLSWLWRRRFHESERIRAATPRRLVYCLPMRVLVEQTYGECMRWLHRLGLLAGRWEEDPRGYRPKPEADPARDGWAAREGVQGKAIGIHLLMGGEAPTDWALWSELDAILIGTQDMLLSRALNRGYAASRYRWPMEFGLLNNDCLWVFDEVQLMDASVATSAQLEAFRRKMHAYGPVKSLWMSATLDKAWLQTVDFDGGWLKAPAGLGADKQVDRVRRRREAFKPVRRSAAAMGDPIARARAIAEEHRPGTRTLAVFNKVSAAVETYKNLKTQTSAELVLIHSRFRAPDRQRKVQALLADPSPEGTIVISTQVVEAGVDVSARALFTELAPWSSLVQRFGRCNRRGEFNDAKDAQVNWFDWPTIDEFQRQKAEKLKDKKIEDIEEEYRKFQADLSRPYETADLSEARSALLTLPDASPAALERVSVAMRIGGAHVIRRRDMLDLFDTTPDLAGSDVDISRFIRSGEDLDVHAFWRDVPANQPPNPEEEHGKAPQRDELCSAPTAEFRRFVERRRGQVWRWNPLERAWTEAEPRDVYPGQTFLVRSSAGGYDAETGWNPDSEEHVMPIDVERKKAESNEGDEGSATPGAWAMIAEHTDDVCRELRGMLAALPVDEETGQALAAAARWHDRGKAHSVFQDAISTEARPEAWAGRRDVAKAPKPYWRRYERRHFRHELASALAMLETEEQELAAYLAAAHHGKVRLSIRSLPGEVPPKDDARRLYARGLWDGDKLDAVELGGGIKAPAITLSLESMQVGRSPGGRPSWAERALKLLDKYGPFRLAYLEALLRNADMRASRVAGGPPAADGREAG